MIAAMVVAGLPTQAGETDLSSYWMRAFRPSRCVAFPDNPLLVDRLISDLDMEKACQTVAKAISVCKSSAAACIGSGFNPTSRIRPRF
jgi:hypothetical protein